MYRVKRNSTQRVADRKISIQYVVYKDGQLVSQFTGYPVEELKSGLLAGLEKRSEEPGLKLVYMVNTKEKIAQSG